MKNVKKCSLSGIAFTMDTDAYDTLKAYMDSLRESCGQTPDGDEIVADIEARIAELILSTRTADSVVELPLVENIIKQMGRPEEISSESKVNEPEPESGGNGCDGEPAGKKGAAANEPRIPRRLYRDMENAKLGGVCAGLAKYFNTDPVWVRLLLMLPLLLTPAGNLAYWLGQMFFNLFGMFILAYIVMWFAVPPARSARQKLEMNGERITAQSIKDTTVASSAADADSEAKPVVANVVTVFGQILLILLKIVAGIIVFGLILTACALIIGMLVVIISGEGVKDFTVIVSSLGISVALLPVILLIYVLMCLIASRKPGTKTVIGMFIVWVIAIMALIIAALHEYGRDGSFTTHRRTRVTSRTEVVVDGDTVNAVRSVRENDDAEAVPDVDISFERDSARFTVTESALPEAATEQI